MFNGKINYFDWAIFNSYVKLPEGNVDPQNQPFLGRFSGSVLFVEGKVAWFNQRLWFKSQTCPFLIPTAPPSEDMDRDWACPTSLKKIGIGQRCQSHPQKWRRSRRWCNILIRCKLEDCMKVKVHQTGSYLYIYIIIYRSLTIYQYIQFNMNIYEYMFSDLVLVPSHSLLGNWLHSYWTWP